MSYTEISKASNQLYIASLVLSGKGVHVCIHVCVCVCVCVCMCEGGGIKQHGHDQQLRTFLLSAHQEAGVLSCVFSVVAICNNRVLGSAAV